MDIITVFQIKSHCGTHLGCGMQRDRAHSHGKTFDTHLFQEQAADAKVLRLGIDGEAGSGRRCRPLEASKRTLPTISPSILAR